MYSDDDGACLGFPVRAVGKAREFRMEHARTFEISLTISHVACQILPHVYDLPQRKHELHRFIAQQCRIEEIGRWRSDPRTSTTPHTGQTKAAHGKRTTGFGVVGGEKWRCRSITGMVQSVSCHDSPVFATAMDWGLAGWQQAG